MTAPLLHLIQAFVHRANVRLAPDWATPAAAADFDAGDERALAALADTLSWPAPVPLRRRPRANAFPLMLFTPATGWAIAEQWQSMTEIRAVNTEGVFDIPWDDNLRLVELALPATPGTRGFGRAFDVVWSALMRRKRMLFEASVATVVVNLIALATSIYSMQVYDRVIPRNGFSTLWVLTGGMIFALLVDFLIRNTRSLLVDRESADIDAEISEYFFDRTQAIRLDSRPGGIGTLAAQLRGVEQIRSMLASASLFLVADLPFAFLFIAVMAAIGGMVAIVPLVIFPLSLALAFLFSRLIRQDAARAQVTGNRKNGLLVEVLDAAETIKANLGRWHILAKWTTLIDDVHAHDQRVRRWSTLATSTFSLLQQISYVGIVVWGSYLVGAHDLTMGGLIACTIISGRINGPLVAALPGWIMQWGYTRSSLVALDAILDMPSDQPTDQAMVRLTEPRMALHLDTVEFTHPGTRARLSVKSLDIGPGERIGVIGTLGSGKTTLLRLLAGLYAPQQGHIMFDGIDLRQISEDALRSHICYFPQDYRLIDGTLRDNLAMGLPHAGEESLIAAARQTGLVQLVTQHPRGLDLPIAEGGRGLSGGQRALVGLTRMLMAKPRLLLLDEPTASLDPDSETRALDALLGSLDPEASVVLVTHKFQLLNRVARLIVVNNGQIVLDGPTHAVLEKLRAPAAAPVAAAT